MLIYVKKYIYGQTDYPKLWFRTSQNIPAFQHRIFPHLSIFSYKTLNFVAVPKILKEVMVKKVQEKSLIGPENTRTTKNGKTFFLFDQIFLKKSSAHLTHGLKTTRVMFLSLLQKTSSILIQQSKTCICINMTEKKLIHSFRFSVCY